MSAPMSGNLPSRTLVAISQAEAALTTKSFASLPIMRRARRDKRALSVSHQRKA